MEFDDPNLDKIKLEIMTILETMNIEKKYRGYRYKSDQFNKLNKKFDMKKDNKESNYNYYILLVIVLLALGAYFYVTSLNRTIDLNDLELDPDKLNDLDNDL